MDNKYFEEFSNYDFKGFSNWLFGLNSYEFSFIASLLGFLISPSLNLNEQNSLGNFLELLGQVILMINSQWVTIKQKNRMNSSIKITNIIDIKKEINDLKREVIQLRKDALNNDRN